MTISIVSVIKMSTFTAGNAETTAFITRSLNSFNFLTGEVAVHSPFDVTSAVVPILTVYKLMLHNDQNGAKHKFGQSGKILKYNNE